ncbi:MAG: hypothetical protein ACUVX8_10755 [Candidatus Zipacnadales bacterium]
MDKNLMLYRETALKAVHYQLEYQRPDGGYIWEGYADDAFHKQAYSWSLAGYVEHAHRLVTWARDNRLQPDGRLLAYRNDVYKHSWFVQGAHRLARFDVTYPVMTFLLSCQAPCGGFPHFEGDTYLRSLATCCAGLSALYLGRLDVAQRCGQWAISVLQQQPDESRFYFRTTRDGRLVTPEIDASNALHINTAKPKQNYWEVGLPLQLMCKLYQATGTGTYLDYAGRFFEFKLRCHDDAFTFVGSGKSSLGAALYYLCTGDHRARQAACQFADFLVETQYPEGGWRDEDEPDTLLTYIDHAAEFSIWLQEIVATLSAADVRWKR